MTHPAAQAAAHRSLWLHTPVVQAAGQFVYDRSITLGNGDAMRIACRIHASAGDASDVTRHLATFTNTSLKELDELLLERGAFAQFPLATGAFSDLSASSYQKRAYGRAR